MSYYAVWAFNKSGFWLLRAGPDSVIDLLFSMDKMSFTSWMDVWNFLEDQFGIEVDLIPEQDLRAELRASVLSEVRYV